MALATLSSEMVYHLRSALLLNDRVTFEITLFRFLMLLVFDGLKLLVAFVWVRSGSVDTGKLLEIPNEHTLFHDFL